MMMVSSSYLLASQLPRRSGCGRFVMMMIKKSTTISHEVQNMQRTIVTSTILFNHYNNIKQQYQEKQPRGYHHPQYRFMSELSTNELALIHEMAREPQTSVSLQALMRTGRGEYLHRMYKNEDIQKTIQEKHQGDADSAATELVLIQVASFLRRELPIRLAHRIQDLEGIPILRDMNHIRLVRDLYIQSFFDIVNFDSKITDSQQEQLFSQLIEKIYERHSSVLVQMARGAYEFRNAVRQGNNCDGNEFELQEETHAFLDRFYLCRIGIRVLIGQYLALRQSAVENYVGIVCSQTSPYEIVKRAIDDAAFMCTRKYGDSPEVIISGRLDLSFPYVPTHLRKFSFLYFVCI
jgi:Mitochondrial branched-chain alpha-ketoacid dehydrogenase kinase